MTEEQIVTIEINGVKMDVDMRHAKVRKTESLKVGDRVKLLQKKYGNSYEVNAGVVIGFDAFNKLPTIIIACLGGGYNSTAISFLYFNEKSTDAVEVIKADDEDPVIDHPRILEAFDREISKKIAEADEVRSRKQFYEKHFGQVAVAEPVVLTNAEIIPTDRNDS